MGSSPPALAPVFMSAIHKIRMFLSAGKKAAGRPAADCWAAPPSRGVESPWQQENTWARPGRGRGCWGRTVEAQDTRGNTPHQGLLWAVQA